MRIKNDNAGLMRSQTTTMLRRLKTLWHYWPEVAGIIILSLVLRPALWPAWRRLSTFRADLAILDELHERIPSSRLRELKYMASVIDFINAEIPCEDTICFVGKMSYGIRVKYYTFPREFLPKYHTSTYDELPALVNAGKVQWFIFNGVDSSCMESVRGQLELVYWGDDKAKEKSFQRIYRVRRRKNLPVEITVPDTAPARIGESSP